MPESISTFEVKDRFLSEVKGSQVIIPDLYALLPGWRFEINVNYDSVKNKLDKWFEKYIFPSFHRPHYLSHCSS
jgi:hypothetical protein